MHVLVVPDKFKGTLTAEAAAHAIARGWRHVRPADGLELLPMSDGGDGFGDVVGGLLEARTRSLLTIDAAGRPCRARWGWSATRRIAIIETAQSNGLALLPRGRFHPFDLDTFGVGRLIQAALASGARQCLLGVGGSATNDGGFGLARAMGWRFVDDRGRELTRWMELESLAGIMPPPDPADPCEFVVATDVSNPLLGPRGASRVYGPQKGLRPLDMARAERPLKRLAEVVRSQLGFDSRRPGSGAAGGLGFGLQAFLKAERRLGFDVFAELARLEQRVDRCDLVVTGEGAVDRSTLMGKGVGQLLSLCRRHGRPVVLMCGRVAIGRRPPPGVVAIGSLAELAGEKTAMEQSARCLRQLAMNLARSAVPVS